MATQINAVLNNEALDRALVQCLRLFAQHGRMVKRPDKNELALLWTLIVHNRPADLGCRICILSKEELGSVFTSKCNDNNNTQIGVVLTARLTLDKVV